MNNCAQNLRFYSWCKLVQVKFHWSGRGWWYCSSVCCWQLSAGAQQHANKLTMTMLNMMLMFGSCNAGRVCQAAVCLWRLNKVWRRDRWECHHLWAAVTDSLPWWWPCCKLLWFMVNPIAVETSQAADLFTGSWLKIFCSNIYNIEIW